MRGTALTGEVDHRWRSHALLETPLGVSGVGPTPVVDLDVGHQLQEGDRVHAAYDRGVDWKVGKFRKIRLGNRENATGSKLGREEVDIKRGDKVKVYLTIAKVQDE